jgi:hypothetical protein
MTIYKMCCAHLDVSWLFRIACVCSLYLDLNVRSAWPMYWSGQSCHFSLYTPALLNMFVLCGCDCRWFLIVLFVRIAGFILEFLKSFVMYLVSFPAYVNMTYFFLISSLILMLLFCSLCVCPRYRYYYWLCFALWRRGGNYYQLLFVV